MSTGHITGATRNNSCGFIINLTCKLRDEKLIVLVPSALNRGAGFAGEKCGYGMNHEHCARAFTSNLQRYGGEVFSITLSIMNFKLLSWFQPYRQ